MTAVKKESQTYCLETLTSVETVLPKTIECHINQVSDKFEEKNQEIFPRIFFKRKENISDFF